MKELECCLCGMKDMGFKDLYVKSKPIRGPTRQRRICFSCLELIKEPKQ